LSSFFNDIHKEDDNAIIEKFEPANLRDDFEYALKMFSKALDVILPKKEAEPFIADFKYLSEKRQLIRTYYEGVRYSLRVDGKKVQQLIDDHTRSLDIAELMNPREVTYDNFLGYAAKFKSERARAALVKNKARQIIKEFAPTNPVYYEKLRERLEKIIEEEESRRIKDASYLISVNSHFLVLPRLFSLTRSSKWNNFSKSVNTCQTRLGACMHLILQL
jgi:type I restriction enzyme, R subunit